MRRQLKDLAPLLSTAKSGWPVLSSVTVIFLKVRSWHCIVMRVSS